MDFNSVFLLTSTSLAQAHIFTDVNRAQCKKSVKENANFMLFLRPYKVYNILSLG